MKKVHHCKRDGCWRVALPLTGFCRNCSQTIGVEGRRQHGATPAFTAAEVAEIRKLASAFVARRDIAKRFGVVPTTITNALRPGYRPSDEAAKDPRRRSREAMAEVTEEVR